MWWDFLIVAMIVAVAALYLARRHLRRSDAAPECASCGCGGSCPGKSLGQIPPCSQEREPFSSG